MNDLWKPMSTAPRDSTTIVAASQRRADPVTVLWDMSHKEWRSNVYPFTAFEDGFFTEWTEAPELPEYPRP